MCVYKGAPIAHCRQLKKKNASSCHAASSHFYVFFFGVIAARMQEKCLEKMANDVIFSKKDAAAFNTNEILLKGGVVDKDEK